MIRTGAEIQTNSEHHTSPYQPAALVLVTHGPGLTHVGLILTFGMIADRDAAALALAKAPQTVRLQLATRLGRGAAVVDTWTQQTQTVRELHDLMDRHAEAIATRHRSNRLSVLHGTVRP